MNVLFVCSQNRWRSPTAERVFAVGYGVNTRSAGTSRNAKHTISTKDLLWADIIFLMEYHHKNRLQEKFRRELQHKKMVVLEIPDNYRYMDDDLVLLLKDAVPLFLGV